MVPPPVLSHREPRAAAGRAQRGDKSELPIKKKPQGFFLLFLFVLVWVFFRFGNDRKIKVNAAT